MSARNKLRPTFRQLSEHRGPNDCHTRLSFCKSNAISEATYFALKRQGRGPREIILGKRIIITPEAEADWRRERETESQATRRAQGADAATETTAA